MVSVNEHDIQSQLYKHNSSLEEHPNCAPSLRNANATDLSNTSLIYNRVHKTSMKLKLDVLKIRKRRDK
jgi:hypothetical protein